MRRFGVLGCSLAICGLWGSAHAQENRAYEDAYIEKSAHGDRGGSKHELLDEDKLSDIGPEEDKGARDSMVVDVRFKAKSPVSFSFCNSKTKPGESSTLSFKGPSFGLYGSSLWKVLLPDGRYINVEGCLGPSLKYDHSGGSWDGALFNKSGLMLEKGVDMRRGGRSFAVCIGRCQSFVPLMEALAWFGGSFWIKQGIHRDNFALNHRFSLACAAADGEVFPVDLAVKGGKASVEGTLGLKCGYAFTLEEGPHAGLLEKDALILGDSVKKFDRLSVKFDGLLRFLKASCSGTDVGGSVGTSVERVISAFGVILDVNHVLVKSILDWRMVSMYFAGCSDLASNYGFPTISAKEQSGIVGECRNACEFTFKRCNTLALSNALKVKLASKYSMTFKGGYLHGLFNAAELDGDHRGAFVKSAYYLGSDFSRKFKCAIVGLNYSFGNKKSADGSSRNMHAFGVGLELDCHSTYWSSDVSKR